MTLTPVQTKDTSGYLIALRCSVCRKKYSVAYVEFLGACPICFLKLGPDQRAILKGQEPPVKEQVITTVRDPKPGIVDRLIGMVIAAIAASVAFSIIAWSAVSTYMKMKGQ